MRMGQETGRRPRGVDFQNWAEHVPWELQNLLEKFPGVVVQTASGRSSALALEEKGRVRAPLEFGNGGIHQRGLVQNPANTTSCGDGPRCLGGTAVGRRSGGLLGRVAGKMGGMDSGSVGTP